MKGQIQSLLLFTRLNPSRDNSLPILGRGGLVVTENLGIRCFLVKAALIIQ